MGSHASTARVTGDNLRGDGRGAVHAGDFGVNIGVVFGDWVVSAATRPKV